MGILDKIKGELIDIIEWLEKDSSTMAYRFQRQGNEIKNGAQLIVREGQTAVFISEGQIADVFTPGTYELETKNLPIISKLKGWKYGFQSPFKAEVYFITTRNIDDFRWGTPGPFTVRDKEFGILKVLARGTFTLHVTDAERFIKNVVGTEGEFTKDEIKDRLRKRFVTEAISAIAETGKSFYEMAEHYDDLSKDLKDRLTVPFWEKYGITVDEVTIQNIELAPESAAKVEKRDDFMFAESRMDMYERKARMDAMQTLAANPGSGGMAANMMGMGVGMGMAGQIPSSSFAGPPPPLAGYYLYVNGQQQGPFPAQNLAAMVQQGSLTMATNVWKQGMAEWIAASAVPELALLFQQGPPPPPQG